MPVLCERVRFAHSLDAYHGDHLISLRSVSFACAQGATKSFVLKFGAKPTLTLSYLRSVDDGPGAALPFALHVFPHSSVGPRDLNNDFFFNIISTEQTA